MATLHKTSDCMRQLLLGAVLPLTSDLMFSDKFLMSDAFETNLMLTGVLFLFSAFPILLRQI